MNGAEGLCLDVRVLRGRSGRLPPGEAGAAAVDPAWTPRDVGRRRRRSGRGGPGPSRAGGLAARRRPAAALPFRPDVPLGRRALGLLPARGLAGRRRRRDLRPGLPPCASREDAPAAGDGADGRAQRVCRLRWRSSSAPATPSPSSALGGHDAGQLRPRGVATRRDAREHARGPPLLRDGARRHGVPARGLPRPGRARAGVRLRRPADGGARAWTAPRARRCSSSASPASAPRRASCRSTSGCPRRTPPRRATCRR